MKRKLLLMLLCAALGLGAAQAEVYRVENEADVPADWAEKDTLRLTCIDTNRSDAMVLQSGGEAMMVDSGEGRYRKRVYATLDGYGITELKYLLNTHCDDDHLHGFIYLMYSDLYQVDAFLSPNTTTYVDEEGYHQQAVKATGTKNIPYVQIGDGDELTLGNAKLTIFRCPLPTGQNNRSAACMVQFGDSRAFLTGILTTRRCSGTPRRMAKNSAAIFSKRLITGWRRFRTASWSRHSRRCCSSPTAPPSAQR